jgi:heme-degrading monooxygenase HmoA
VGGQASRPRLNGNVAAFAEAYGPAGPWEALFRQANGFRGTEVFRRTAAPPRFLTLDRWESRSEYEGFRAALDAVCKGMTLRETFLAAWEA